MFLFGGLKKTVYRNIEGFGQNRPLCLSRFLAQYKIRSLMLLSDRMFTIPDFLLAI